MFYFVFFFNDTATTEIYTLSLHDALPICGGAGIRQVSLLGHLVDTVLDLLQLAVDVFLFVLSSAGPSTRKLILLSLETPEFLVHRLDLLFQSLCLKFGPLTTPFLGLAPVHR